MADLIRIIKPSEVTVSFDSRPNLKEARIIARKLGLPADAVLTRWRTKWYGHNSHSHEYSFSVNALSHTHSSGWYTGYTNCGYLFPPATNHRHSTNTSSEGSHYHTISGETSVEEASDLNHTHTFSGTTGDSTSGFLNHHHHITTVGDSYCDSCSPNGHNHTDNNGASGFNPVVTHTHTYSGTTGTGVGTLEAHTHSMGGTVNYDGSHNHVKGGIVVNAGLCYVAEGHDHSELNLPTKTHNHTISGNTDSDGEPPVVRHKASFFKMF